MYCTDGNAARWVGSDSSLSLVVQELSTRPPFRLCLLLPAQGSHDLEKLVRPRGRLSFSRRRLPSGIPAALGNKDPTHHTETRGPYERSNYPFTRPSACNTRETSSHGHGLLGRTPRPSSFDFLRLLSHQTTRKHTCDFTPHPPQWKCFKMTCLRRCLHVLPKTRMSDLSATIPRVLRASDWTDGSPARRRRRPNPLHLNRCTPAVVDVLLMSMTLIIIHTCTVVYFSKI